MLTPPGLRASRARTVPIVPLAITALVALGASAPVEPLRDAITGAPVPGASLRLPPSFVAFTPLLGPLDLLASLPRDQHVALAGTLLVLFAAWRLPRRRASGETAVWLAFLAGVFAVYAALVLMHRPMSALEVRDRELAVVDFHSHSDASHDARARFGLGRNRAWHAAAGFDAAYVTDHYVWRGDGDARRAGEGTVLLTGAELQLAGVHVNVLGDSARYVRLLNRKGRRLLLGDVGGIDPAVRPTLTIPLPLAIERIEPTVRVGRGTVVALEVHDGDPRAIEQLRRERARLVGLAGRLGLAVVSGSNLHGWGRTAAAWTLVRVPGWRDLTPSRLGALLERTLRANEPGSLQVVERFVPYPGSSAAALALTFPAAVLHLFRTLQPLERLVWLAWVWGAWLAVSALRARGLRPGLAERGRTRRSAP